MKPITEKIKKTMDNAWGLSTTFYAQEFMLDETDLGERPHYLGYNYIRKTITQKDIGKIIINLTDDFSWCCWYFKN